MNRFRILGGILLVVFLAFLSLQGCGDSPKKLFQLAGQKFDAGDYLGALSLYEQVADQFPKGRQADDALYWIGIIHHLYLKDDIKSLQAFQRIPQNYPASPYAAESQRYSASILRKLDKPRQAIEAYERLIQMSREPRMVQEGHHRIAEIYFDSGDLDQARNEWEALLRNDPNGALADRALYGISTTYYIQGECAQALEVLNRLIESRPQSDLKMDAQFQAASCLEEQGHLEEALERFNGLREGYANPKALEIKINGLEDQIKKQGHRG